MTPEHAERAAIIPYDACTGWCVAEGVLSPRDLANRIISGSEYKKTELFCGAKHDKRPNPTPED